ncbi:MAG: Crp/Fnr family transcriptional regulator [Bacillaceae bacterium]|nr:Crp/Fnr family transcriptional regulator [Bacillaceae bacterium]
MKSVIEIFRHVDLFKEMSENELVKIAGIANKREFRERAVVFMQGDPLNRVFFIHSGKVKIFKTDTSGKEQIVDILQPGDMFPHAGFFRKGTYPAHAEIVEKAVLAVISIEDFENLLLRYPEISIKLFRVMGEKILDLHKRLEEQVLHNTYEQIIMLLLRLAKNYGEEIEEGIIRLKSRYTNRELASMIGASRETVSRTLTHLRKKGRISIDRAGHIRVITESLKEELFSIPGD